MKRPALTEDASIWYLLWSNQAALLSVMTTLQSMLPFWEGIIPDQWFIVVGAILASAVVILRNIKQPKNQERLERKRGKADV